MQGILYSPAMSQKQGEKKLLSDTPKSQTWQSVSQNVSVSEHGKKRYRARAKRKKASFLSLFYCLVLISVAGVGFGAFLCTQQSGAGNYLRYFSDSYKSFCAAPFSLHLYASLFLSVFVFHTLLMLSSFSCFGLVSICFLMTGKGISIGAVMLLLLSSKNNLLPYIFSYFPYFILSYALALFMAFVAAKQSICLFRIHFLHDKKTAFSWTDSFYFFAVITAVSFICPLFFFFS